MEKLPLQVDRAKVVAWLRDKARDRDETASHHEAEGLPEGFLCNREIGSELRAVAAALERGEPDTWEPPDLAVRERKSRS